MQPESLPSSRNRALIPCILVVTLLLAGSIWAFRAFRAEARVRRATGRVVARVQKAKAESPVALGVAANRLGTHLASNAVLHLDGVGPLATGRPEIVSLFAQIRSSLKVIAFESPSISVEETGEGEFNARVEAQYRLVPKGGTTAAGSGQAELVWTQGKEGWRISHATLHPDPDAALPKGWK